MLTFDQSTETIVFRAIVTNTDGSNHPIGDAQPQNPSGTGDGLPEYDPATAPNAMSSLRSLQGQEREEPGSSRQATLSSNSENWVDTLRELQTNLKALKEAKRTSYFSMSNPYVHKAMAPFIRNKRSSRKRSSANGKGPEDADLSSISEQLEDQERVQNIRVHEQLVLEGMRRLARTHPDPTAQTDWAARAENFARTLEEAKKSGKDGSPESTEEDSIMKDIGKGLALIALTPVALAGACIFASGAIMYGTGKLIVGIGHAMTFGKMR